MKKWTLNFLFFLPLLNFSCSSEITIDEAIYVNIVEEIIAENFSDHKPIKTIQTLMPICTWKEWAKINSFELTPGGPPPPPDFDTLRSRGDHSDFLVDGGSFNSYMKKIGCTNTLKLKNTAFHLISLENLMALPKPERVPFQMFSYPILNKTIDKMVLYRNYYCGSLCGEGSILFFIKKNDKWVLVETRRTWIS